VPKLPAQTTPVNEQAPAERCTVIVAKAALPTTTPVALARNYAFLAREQAINRDLDQKRVQIAKALLVEIIKDLDLPSIKAKQAIEV